MPKNHRKRRHQPNLDDVEFEIVAPKKNFRPFDEEAQAEEEQLSKILFGGASSFLKSLEEAEQEVGASGATSDSGVGEDSSDNDIKERSPAWHDEEDDGIDVGQALDAQGRKLPAGGVHDRANKYSNLLKQKFQSTVGTPSWASLDKRKRRDSDSDEEVLHKVGFLKKGTHQHLPSDLLEFKKVKDLNCETYNEGPFINSVEFHPTSRVGLVAGQNGVATLFAVDGKRNEKLHSILFENYQILCAKFINNGNEVILGSRHNYIYNYDLMSAKSLRIPLPSGLTQFKKFVTSPDSKYIAVAGKWGEIQIFTAASKERIATLKQNNPLTALAYNPRGNHLYGHSDSGVVTIFDMNMNRAMHTFEDEGCLQGTTLSLSSSNQFFASGSAQGVVNVYNVADIQNKTRPTPKKSIMNLTTSITDLKFNPNSEILAFCSVEIKNAVRLFHLGSNAVFSNFPAFGTKLGNINAVNFSPNGGYAAFGNNKSIVSLFTLKHYKGY